MVHSLNLITIPLCLPAFKSLISLELVDVWIDSDDPTGWVAFRDVLMALESLDYLELRLGCFSVTPHCLPVVLPTIRFLNVDASACPGALGLLISCVQAASVTTLSLAAWGGVDVEDQLNLADDLELHFPSLKHLILAKVVVLDHVQVDMFARRFPDIERLTCWSECLAICDIDKVIIAIVRGNADNEVGVGVGGGARWPQLRTIAVSTPELEEHYNASALESMIQKLQDVIQCWKNAGHGIRKLILPISISRTGTEAMTELGKIVEIGQYHVDWPQFADPLYKRVVGE
ncbi:hypothetical protein FIBSPDRAFT_928126 [Athelia psychrophila]|uniref:F-box domain-containing protein n=1 Tax=Athelia psychrophila TaxID=1759441 RepID=A0A166QWK3_9AGAM|nr:hypothetical protein FIBSPDRAFT_928126 [Fibularhizoctonia sp. CBS 109695]